MSIDLPRRGRRSSISEHIHRVFHVDRPDKVGDPLHHTSVVDLVIDSSKKRESIQSDGSPRQTTTRPVNGSLNFNPETAISDSTPADDSFSHSLKTGQPTSSTPRSTPPFNPAAVEDDPSFLERIVSLGNERDLDCTSPTWHKDNARKERRATKRLEADRKVLEERLLRLETNQARLEHGIYERNPRRLTKKQQLGSARRSSSANAERPRPSSAFSAFFSGSRRSSRSRASSVNGSDSAPRRCSSEAPPTLSLTLPERFGAAVSRELATRQGTFLLPSHQQTHPTVHSTPKLDDLRENWRMAEAWKRNYTELSSAVIPGQNSESEMENRTAPPDMARMHDAQSPRRSQVSSADLDRDRFTANLRHVRKPLPPRPTAACSSSHNPASKPDSQLPKDETSVQIRQQTKSMPARVTTARQLQELGQREIVQKSSERVQAENVLPSSTMSLPSRRSQEESPPQVHSRMYKFSPLAAKPSDPNEHGSVVEMGIPAARNGTPTESAMEPFRPSHLLHSKKTESQNHPPMSMQSGHVRGFPSSQQLQPVKSPLNTKYEYDIRPAENVSPGPTLNDRDGTPEGASISPKQAHVLKHAGRSVSLGDKLHSSVAEGHCQSPEAERDPMSSQLKDSVNQNDSGQVQTSRASPDMSCPVPPARSRSLSESSSQASYNTADEEILHVSQLPQCNGKFTESNAPTRSPRVSAKDTLQVQKRTTGRGKTQNQPLPPLAPDGPVTVLRKKPKQKVSSPLPGQMVAKVFVICCRCKYWHDMPSEVYAKLACPERLPSDLLARPFTRRNSSAPKGSLRHSLLSADPDPSERLRLPTPRRPLSNGDSDRAAREFKAAAGAALTPPSCCWCGHNMSRSCCQGWTTLVHMRERHH